MISPVAAADLHPPVVRGAATTDPEETDMSETWPTGVDAARWLRGACSSGNPLRSAVVAVCDEVERLRILLRQSDEQVESANAAAVTPVRPPRVWLPGDTVPVGVTVIGQDGIPAKCAFDGTRVDPRQGRALVEVLVPDYAAAVAAERARRALSAAEPPAEAGSGNGAGEAREAASGRPGASHGPAEGEGSDR